jgi:hypothetical protein
LLRDNLLIRFPSFLPTGELTKEELLCRAFESLFETDDAWLSDRSGD